MGSLWTLVLCWGLSKPSSQESRSGSYGSVNLATGTEVGSENVNSGVFVWARVVADIVACSLMVGAAAGCVFLRRLVRGFLLRATRACWLFCFPLFGQ